MSLLPNQSYASVGVPFWTPIDSSGGSGAGPTGPAGSTGPTGPQGPTGASSSGALTLMFWADQTNTNANGSLAIVDRYSNVIINNGITINNNGTSNASLTLPASGTYLIDVNGWICGSGTGVSRVIGTRGGSTVYDRTRGWDVGCAVGNAKYLWDGFQSNDVLQIYKNVNNTGTYTPSISNSTQQDGWGQIAIYYVR